MKISIKTKMILCNTLIIIFCLTVGAIYSYNYLSNILKERVVKDEKEKLSQICYQMKYIIEDTKIFSYNIITDSDIQRRLKNISQMSAIDRVFEIDYIIKEMQNYIRSRNYIQSVAFVFKDGTTYWSNDPYDSYFSERLKENWYLDSKKIKADFTKVHTLFNNEARKDEQVISRIMPITDINSVNNNLGELIVNINYDFFKGIIDEGGEGFKDFIWTNQNNNVFLKKDITNKTTFNMLQSVFHKYNQINSEPRVLKENSEYILISQPIQNGWIMNAFIYKVELFKKLDFLYHFFWIFLVTSIVICVAINVFVTLGITKPLSKLMRGMRKVSKGQLDVSLTISSRDEIEEIACVFNSMVSDLKEYISKLLEEEQLKKNMEFNLLLLQINPHFIYNTLSTVIYLARKSKNYDIVNMMEAFIKILQDTVKLGEEGLVNSVIEEKEIIDHYILIQQYRYKDKFTLKWDIQDAVINQLIPKTIIQPFVENALFHGLSPKESNGCVSISIYKDGSNLIIIVEDDGVGMDSQAIEKILTKKSFNQFSSSMRHIGIVNTDSRIKYFYGEQYGIGIESIKGKGTTVKIKLPINIEKTNPSSMK